MTHEDIVARDLDGLRERLAETERLAEAASHVPSWWKGNGTSNAFMHLYEADKQHVAHNDPERMLGWVRVVREMLAAYEWGKDHRHEDQATGYWVRRGEIGALEETLRLIAAYVYGQDTKSLPATESP
jgi:hypothetical protein